MKPSLLLFILLLNFSAIFVGKAQAEEFPVGNLQITFIDPDRSNRAILTEIYYPITDSGEPASGSFPLLVFGHGFLMEWSAYENLWSHFVPQGYVMAFPRTEGGFSPSHQDFALDIAFLASAIQELNDDSDSPLYQALNGRTAAMGHSMGGGAAVLATSYSNHIDVYLGLAPAETNPSAVSAAQNITQPALIISGSADDVTPESTHQIPIYEALSTESRSLVSITGGGHCYFANFNFYCNLGESGTSGNITITREEQQQTTADFANLWLDFFLKDNCDSWDELQDSLHNSLRITFLQNTIIGNPEISLQADTLYSTEAHSYQWYFNGEPIIGAEEAFLIPEVSGNYQVETSYFNTCKWLSDALQVEMPAAVSGLTDSDIRVYPNPASEMLFIKMPSHHHFSEVQLLSIDGAVQLSRKIKTGQDFNLDVSILQPGYYILQFFGQGKQIVRKVMVK